MTSRQAAPSPVLGRPPTGGSIWPGQSCPAFAQRTAGLGCTNGCWFCRYADFHLRQQVALEVGICCWPRQQMD